MKTIEMKSTPVVEKSAYRAELRELLSSEKFVIPVLCLCVAVVLVGAAIGSPEMMAAAGVIIILASTPLMKRYIDEAEKEDEL